MKINQGEKKHHCSSEGLKILGDFWTLYLIKTLSPCEKRFCELERELEGINPTTLTQRLKTLEQEHIVIRHEKTVDKLSVTYALTEKGQAILPIIKEIEKFTHTYIE